MKVLDLFSGIGGFSLGLHRAGFQTVAFCEREPYCQQILQKHWPEVPIYDDIKTLTADRLKQDNIGPIELICGGFPCQPFSLAGQRRGQDDDRHLWPEMVRLIKELRPRWVIGENVTGLISMGLDSVLSDLEDQNYTTQTFVIPACAVDAPHRRDRVWIVGHTTSPRCRTAGRSSKEIYQPREIQRPPRSDCRSQRRINPNTPIIRRHVQQTPHQPAAGLQPQKQARELCGDAATLANTNNPGNRTQKHDSAERTTPSKEWTILQPKPSRLRETLAHPNTTRLQERQILGACQSQTPTTPQGQTAQRSHRWLPEPPVGRVANGIPQRVDRLRALGNAVVPQVVEQLGHAINQAESENQPHTGAVIPA